MLVGMDSKASHAKGMPGVTLTIAPCLCAAFRARMRDVQCVPLVECRVYTFQLPSPFCCFTMTCLDNVRARVRTGDAAATPLSFSLFVIIRVASFFAKFQCRHCHSFFARARVCTAFTSVTDKRKVNCRLGHHFVAQTSSKLGS